MQPVGGITLAVASLSEPDVRSRNFRGRGLGEPRTSSSWDYPSHKDRRAAKKREDRKKQQGQYTRPGRKFLKPAKPKPKPVVRPLDRPKGKPSTVTTPKIPWRKGRLVIRRVNKWLDLWDFGTGLLDLMSNGPDTLGGPEGWEKICGDNEPPINPACVHLTGGLAGHVGARTVTPGCDRTLQVIDWRPGEPITGGTFMFGPRNSVAGCDSRYSVWEHWVRPVGDPGLPAYPTYKPGLVVAPVDDPAPVGPAVQPDPWPFLPHKPVPPGDVRSYDPASPSPKPPYGRQPRADRPKRRPDKKQKWSKAKQALFDTTRAVQKKFHNMTEVMDFINALGDHMEGFPKKGTPVEKLRFLFEHADEIDPRKAVRDLLANQLEDAILGPLLGKRGGGRPVPKFFSPV